jgi:hypothetical protein
MGRSRDVLIPARFLLTAGNFITVVLAFYNVDANVASGVAAGGDAAAAKSSLLAALSISVIAFAPQFFGLFGGATLFLDELNLFHSVLHFFGGVLTAWYLIDSWGYASYWCVLRRANVGPRGGGLFCAAAGRTPHQRAMPPPILPSRELPRPPPPLPHPPLAQPPPCAAPHHPAQAHHDYLQPVARLRRSVCAAPLVLRSKARIKEGCCGGRCWRESAGSG